MMLFAALAVNLGSPAFTKTLFSKPLIPFSPLLLSIAFRLILFIELLFANLEKFCVAPFFLNCEIVGLYSFIIALSCCSKLSASLKLVPNACPALPESFIPPPIMGARNKPPIPPSILAIKTSLASPPSYAVLNAVSIEPPKAPSVAISAL